MTAGRLGDLLSLGHRTRGAVSDIMRYIGPGLVVTVGFIDPGNWAANVAAGAGYGYTLLWMVTLSTVMLILLQHNAAHLGIVTGDCLAEAAVRHLSPWLARPLLFSAFLASGATAMAELLGAAIALRMLFGLPLRVGTLLTLALVLWLLFGTAYRRLERTIIGFVSLIGFAFVFELWLTHTDWGSAAVGWVVPAIPGGALPVVMSVLGAVVMPHNLFLHSEIIQSRQWQLAGEEVIASRLKFEFLDTLLSMGIGWAINSAMILVAAATFWERRIPVTDLSQAKEMLRPLLGPGASLVFAAALLLAGVASSITAAMSGGSIVAGMFSEPYNSGDPHTRFGIAATLAAGAGAVFLVTDPFRGLILSQILLSVQLPWTILLQLRLTSSGRVMGRHANRGFEAFLLWATAATVVVLNIMLLRDMLR
jgi:manganese transport protein